MTTCALCLEEKPLRQSHIFADCCYRHAYAEDGRAVAVHVDDGLVQRERPIQSGTWQYLLCADCEALLNKHETYFARSWLDHSPLPSPLRPGDTVTVTVQYAPFKLFHLANLWRAGVSSKDPYGQVALGSHAERMRRMLLAGDPGRPQDYPVAAFCLIQPDGSLHNQVVSPVVPTRLEGHTVYAVIHSGFEWLIRVSSHPLEELDGAALRPDGSLDLLVVPWQENDLLRGIARIYGRHKAKGRT